MNTSDLVYLDWAATAPLSPAAADAMAAYLTPGVAGLEAGLANANSLYGAGRVAFRALERAREDLARALGARPDEVIFTSGATEADNAALFGIVEALTARADQAGTHDYTPRVVVSSIEHDAVLRAAQALARRGAEVVTVDPDATGHIAPAALEAAMGGSAALVSIMAVNNEVGSVMDVRALADAAHRAGALFHVDATQALGKVPVSLKAWGADALSVSSHKVGGPKGVGALCLKARTPFVAQVVGGGQESGQRSGTQNVMGAVGFAAACCEAVRAQPVEASRLVALRDELYERLCAHPRVRATVPVEPGDGSYAPHIVNVLVRDMESETLILQLDRRGVCVSGGSACSSHSLGPSHVLSALGIARDDALGSLRVSMGFATTHEDVERFLAAFDEVVG